MARPSLPARRRARSRTARRRAWPPTSTTSAWRCGTSRRTSTRPPASPCPSPPCRWRRTCGCGAPRRSGSSARAASRRCSSRCTARRSSRAATWPPRRPPRPTTCAPTSPSQRALQERLAAETGLDVPARTRLQRQLFAWDWLSLALLLGWAPGRRWRGVPGGARGGSSCTWPAPRADEIHALRPWPFSADEVHVVAEGRRLAGRATTAPELHAALERRHGSRSASPSSRARVSRPCRTAGHSSGSSPPPPRPRRPPPSWPPWSGFLRDTAPPLAPAEPAVDRWQRAALLEGVEREAEAARAWPGATASPGADERRRATSGRYGRSDRRPSVAGVDGGAPGAAGDAQGGTPPCEYLLLIYGAEKAAADMSDRRARPRTSWVRELHRRASWRAGTMSAATRCSRSTTATTVRVRDGETLVTDGPFAETQASSPRRLLPDRRAGPRRGARRGRRRCPSARYGSVEVRPIMEFDERRSRGLTGRRRRVTAPPTGRPSPSRVPRRAGARARRADPRRSATSSSPRRRVQDAFAPRSTPGRATACRDNPGAWLRRRRGATRDRPPAAASARASRASSSAAGLADAASAADEPATSTAAAPTTACG